MSGQSAGLWRATLISLLVAAVVLFTVVLPAEYDLDPLGTGEMLGLTGLSRDRPQAVMDQAETHRVDRIRFELAPFESVEYKYRLEAGAGVVFSWSATAEVVFDFHAEPDGAEPGYAESFEQGRGLIRNGTYIAPFSGIHGWFWENRGAQPLLVDLAASGFMSAATEFRDGDMSTRTLDPVRELSVPPGVSAAAL